MYKTYKSIKTASKICLVTNSSVRERPCHKVLKILSNLHLAIEADLDPVVSEMKIKVSIRINM